MWYKVNKIYVWTNLVRPSSRLPSAYQEVEWIWNSWTQYIETPFKVQDQYIYKSKLQYTQLWWWNFGWYYAPWSNSRLYLGLRWDVSPIQRWYWLGSNTGNLWNVSTWKDYEVEAKLFNGSQYLKVNWTTLHTASFSYSSSYSFLLYVFAETYNPWVWPWQAYAKMYWFKLYNTSNELVLDFVPCYRKSDNVIGMYDLVNNQFYTNSWSWTFTKWPDVN